jgi:hypothetical protein
MKNLARALAVLMTALSISSMAGIRGPGKYYGVVVFDRWETCYIYSGVYLMYVSQRVNEPLRKYEGQAMVIDALSVDQPMNPGDGRIDRFRVIGAATSRRRQVQLDGLSIRVSPRLTLGSPKFVLEIRNQGKRRIEMHSWEIALTLLGSKTKHNSAFDPSDGLSTALITRTGLGNSRRSGTSNNGDAGCFWTIGDKPLPDFFTLKAGQKYSITISLILPRGEYDFLCGYGGGVHEDKSLATNIVAFDVDEDHKATLVSISRR